MTLHMYRKCSKNISLFTKPSLHSLCVPRLTLSLYFTFLKVTTKIWVIWKLLPINLMTEKSYLIQTFVFSFRKSQQIMYIITYSTNTLASTPSATKIHSTAIHRANKAILYGECPRPSATRSDPRGLPASPPLLLPLPSRHRKSCPPP